MRAAARGDGGSESPVEGDRAARAPAGAALVRPARGLVRVLYTSNPFDVLSADLVFAGLRISFGPGGPAAESWRWPGAYPPTRSCWRRPRAS